MPPGGLYMTLSPNDVFHRTQPTAIYLNTALMGVPPEPAVRAVRELVDQWAIGALDWQAGIDRISEVRQRFAGLINQPADRIAIGHTVAATLSGIATSLEPGSAVLLPEGEHNSVVYPFLRRPDLLSNMSHLRASPIPLHPDMPRWLS